MTDTALYDYQARLTTIPHEPGVYLMKDRRGTIIYIGKSVDLRARVRSYFNGGDPRPFVQHLPKVLGDIEILVTDSGEEALRLEAALIRQHLPRYNIAIKRHGVWLRLDERDPWPRVQITRRPEPDGARYFGEYPTGRSAWATTQLLERHFLLRTCDDAAMKLRSRPCLQHQIKRCLAPCVLSVDRAEYREQVEQVKLFLEGRAPELRLRLEEKMWQASEALDFEVAARLRDQLKGVDAALNREEITDEDRIPRDVFGLHREGDRASFQVMSWREGRVRDAEAFHFTHQEFPDAEILSSFLQQLYLSSRRELPQELLLPCAIEDARALAAVLSQERGGPVLVLGPDDHEAARAQMVEAATRNALYAFQKHHGRQERAADQLARLQERLRLWRVPKRIECFDISNLQDQAIVAGMVVFVDGEPARSEYRVFHIRHQGQDDFASLREAVTRRFRRSLTGGWPMPELVIIDGGRGQLGAAQSALEDLGLEGVPMIALAKSRPVGAPNDNAEARAVTPERVFLVGRSNPLILRRNSPELLILQRIRDEAHAHALGAHRRLLRRQLLEKGTVKE
jgi:excinuclease ABC subunit C